MKKVLFLIKTKLHTFHIDLLRYIDIEYKRLDNLTTFLPIYEEYILEHLLVMIINYKNSFWFVF